MIELLPAPGHVFAVRFVDKLTGPDFDAIEREIESRLAQHGRIGIVADLTELRGVTPQALAKDIRYNLSKLGHWRQFPREAIVSPKGWAAAAAKVLDPIVPQVEVRSFHPEERAEAIAWAADFTP
jgi:hypothetical protein